MRNPRRGRFARPDGFRSHTGSDSNCMLQFARNYTRPDGLAPQVGDADDGRFLPLGDYGRADPRRHLHLFAQANRPYEPVSGHAAYGAGGYYVMRSGGLYVCIRCGDIGLHGIGAHAHNDQLSFELCAGATPLIVDPGAYVYTADPAARNVFRSTGYHATLSVDGAEQNELRSDYLFSLADRTYAEPLAWEPGDQGAVFVGRHRGFEALDPPAVHERRLELHGAQRAVTVRDTISVGAQRGLQWTFPLNPAARVDVGSSRVLVWADDLGLEIEGENLDFSVEEGWFSPRYGVRVRAPFVRARRPSATGADVQNLVLTVR